MTTVVHCKHAYSDVYIGRPGPWGNPFTHLSTKTLAKYKTLTRDESISAFAFWVQDSQEAEAQWIREHAHELKGKTLGCWCRPYTCHGDVLAKMAEEGVDAY